MALCNTFETITNTNWIYPLGDLQYVIDNTLIPLTATADTLYFNSYADMADFYDQVWERTAIAQPNGNQGYSLGVGTILLDLQDQLYFNIGNNLVVMWRLVKQLTDQSTLPSGGDSPNGTTGYLTILEDWPLEERPYYYDPVLYQNGEQIECPEETFGFSQEAVELINARHGSIANFLRLRNLGMI